VAEIFLLRQGNVSGDLKKKKIFNPCTVVLQLPSILYVRGKGGVPRNEEKAVSVFLLLKILAATAFYRVRYIHTPYFVQ
jgi:hypothetical protein